MMSVSTASPETRSFDKLAYSSPMPDLDVLGSRLHYEEQGSGLPVVFLHGNPTSSYLWRSVIPAVAGSARCLAPDLMGMGRSDKPDIAYRFEDHARYLDAWFEALSLDRVTLVGHDWGGALGFDWAARHRDLVSGVAFMETIVRPVSWDMWPEAARDLFQGFRQPGVGEDLVLDKNLFVEAVLPASVLRDLTDEEMDTYRAPFLERDHRRPVLAWPREIPIDGEPPDVVARVTAYDQWLSTSDDVPKLLLTFTPGAIVSPPVVDWCRENIAALEVEHIGPGVHFVQEDHGPAIGAAVMAWRNRHGIGG